MTVSSTTNKVSYSGNGSNDTFAYTFKIFADADLKVFIRDSSGTETLKTITTHYTVTNAGVSTGGNVVFTSGNIPSATDTVVIQRELTLTQGTDYVENDPFPAQSHEDALDRLTFVTQQIQEEVDRSIKASVTNTIAGAEFALSASDRANKVFAFDGSGDLSVTQELGTFRGNWAASTDYSVRDLIKDTSTNNIFIVNTAHTSSGSQPLTSNANSAKYDLIVDAATATSAQTAAASSASSASTSASTATTKASEAATSATNAASSATAAAASETAAAASETASAASETASAASETAAAASQTAAAASASSASSSASTATTKASEASTSATTATTKATEAASSATTASTQASNASTSASTATTKASEASTSATNAASSATAAASSATAAASSQTAAASSAAAAASALDSFDDRYLGVKSSNPTQDNDGNPLVSGALYFNDSANEMRVYDGANWIAATSAGNVSLILYEYNAGANQTTFSGSDTNSATLSYTVDNLQVVVNGIVLDPSDFTATNGTSVVLASGAAAGDVVNIYAFKSFTTADMVSKTNGGTFAGAVTFDGGANFGDNDKAQFGAGNDLQIYHDGSNSYIDDTATGDLIVRASAIYLQKYTGETLINAVADGAAKLYFDAAEKLATTSTGIDVTGTVTADGLTVDGNVGIGTSSPTLDSSLAGLSVSSSSTLLHINDSDGACLKLSDPASGANRGLGIALQGTSAAISNCESGELRFGTGNTERMRIDSSGNVGIGLSSNIDRALHVQVDNDYAVKFGGTSSGDYAIEIGQDGGGGSPGFNATGTGASMKFSMSGTERMRIDSSANLLLGATTARTGDNTLSLEAGNSLIWFQKQGTGLQTQVVFNRDTTGTPSIAGTIQTNGTSVLYNTSSDHRLKENVADMTGAIDRVKALAPKRFNFIADADRTVDGFLAHEAQAVVPEAVGGTHNEVETWTQQEIDDGDAPDGTSAGDNKLDGDGNTIPVMQGIDQAKLVPLLTGALQEAIAKIETLETKVAALEAAE